MFVEPFKNRRVLKALAVFAALFGVATVFAGGRVLFGDESARQAAGAVVPFVLWFNFGAGFFYLAAALGLWQRRPWAARLALGIAAATGLLSAAFALHVAAGGAYELRTVGALGLRVAVWALIGGIALRRLPAGQPAEG